MPDTQDQAVNPSLAANTTYQQDLVSAGQRRINVIWEFTQAFIACAVVLANMIVGIYDGLTVGGAERHDFPVILSSSLFLVVGFYFSRTNHAAIGGVGDKPMSHYSGR